MKIEVVAFYPYRIKTKNSLMIGTMHIFLPSLAIEVRGIRVFRKGKRVLFFMNKGIYDDPETGKRKQYPIFSFKCLDKNKSFMETLQHVGFKFIESKHPECLATLKH